MNGNALPRLALFSDPSYVWMSTGWRIDGVVEGHVLVPWDEMVQTFGEPEMLKRNEGMIDMVIRFPKEVPDPSRPILWVKWYGEIPAQRGQSYLGAFVPILTGDE